MKKLKIFASTMLLTSLLNIAPQNSSNVIIHAQELQINNKLVKPQGLITGAYIVKVVVDGIIVGYVTVSVIDGIIAGITNTDGLKDVVKKQVQNYIGKKYYHGFAISGTSNGSGGGNMGGFNISY